MTDKLEALSQPAVWGLFEFSSNKLYHSMQDKLDAENYLNQVHQSNDSITLNIEPLYSQEYVTALIQRAVAAELREKETSARAAQADLWAKALVELDEKMKEAARILKSGERLALSRAIMILEGQGDD